MRTKLLAKSAQTCIPDPAKYKRPFASVAHTKAISVRDTASEEKPCARNTTVDIDVPSGIDLRAMVFPVDGEVLWRKLKETEREKYEIGNLALFTGDPAGYPVCVSIDSDEVLGQRITIDGDPGS